MQKIITLIFIIIILQAGEGLIASNLSSTDSINVHDGKPFSIEFVEEISSSTDILKEKSIGKKIIDWIFGDDRIDFIRPMGILNNNKNGLVVLDQGGGFIINIDTIKQKVDRIMDDNDQIFQSLVGICGFKNNNFLFTDSRQNHVYLYDYFNNSVALLNKNIIIDQPTGIAYNHNNGEIWVLETLQHRIVVMDENGNFLRYIGKRGEEDGQFNFPTFICIDKNGLIYVIDSMNFRLQILDSSGKFLKSFGEAGDASGFFARPKGVAVDSYGHIYVVDALFNSVQIFDKDGQFLYYFGKKGNQQGEFLLPTGIFIDSNDFIYVADSFNSRIQIFRIISNEKK